MEAKTLPPIQLEARYDSRVWGGNRLAQWLNLPAAPSPLGEIWLVYAENIIATGPLQGQTLAAAAERYGALLLGSVSFERSGSQFPLLAKFIDAADHLSVQVHPDDTYAHTVEAATGFNGKTEAWYLLQTEANAQLIHGFKHQTSREECSDLIANDRLPELLRYVPAHAGTTIFVPAGTIHAINAGVMLFEIQQTSDLTYRIYDYGRPREMHIERALDVLDYAASAPAETAPTVLDSRRTLLVKCRYFAMERWQLQGRVDSATLPTSFEIITVIDGSATLRSFHGVWELTLGTTLVLPASLGAYTYEVANSVTLLRCYVPTEEL